MEATKFEIRNSWINLNSDIGYVMYKLNKVLNGLRGTFTTVTVIIGKAKLDDQ